MHFKIISMKVFQGIILKSISDPKHIAVFIIELI